MTLNERDRFIDLQAQMLTDIKMARHYDEISQGKARHNPVKISEFGLYECHLPLPDQKDFLKNYMIIFFKIPIDFIFTKFFY